MVSLAAFRNADEAELIDHCRRISEVIPLFGFYLQPAVGGRVLSHRFWREFCELDRVVGIKIAPFNRYQTLDVVRAVAESGRDSIALYTGNDDNIVVDLVTPFSFRLNGAHGRAVDRRRPAWANGPSGRTARSKLLDECRRVRREKRAVPPHLMRLAAELTDANAAIFDAANGFAGCIAGVHEVLRRQGLLDGVWLLDENESLSPGQAEEIDRVCQAYPHLTDDAFVGQHRGRLAGRINHLPNSNIESTDSEVMPCREPDQPSARLHARRAAGRDRHHRRPGGVALARPCRPPAKPPAACRAPATSGNWGWRCTTITTRTRRFPTRPPPGGPTAGSIHDGNRGWSWSSFILPYIEQQATFTAIDFHDYVPVNNNRNLIKNPIPVGVCPSDGRVKRVRPVGMSRPAILCRGRGRVVVCHQRRPIQYGRSRPCEAARRAYSMKPPAACFITKR